MYRKLGFLLANDIPAKCIQRYTATTILQLRKPIRASDTPPPRTCHHVRHALAPGEGWYLPDKTLSLIHVNIEKPIAGFLCFVFIVPSYLLLGCFWSVYWVFRTAHLHIIRAHCVIHKGKSRSCPGKITWWKKVHVLILLETGFTN